MFFLNTPCCCGDGQCRVYTLCEESQQFPSVPQAICLPLSASENLFRVVGSPYPLFPNVQREWCYERTDEIVEATAPPPVGSVFNSTCGSALCIDPCTTSAPQGQFLVTVSETVLFEGFDSCWEPDGSFSALSDVVTVSLGGTVPLASLQAFTIAEQLIPVSVANPSTGPLYQWVRIDLRVALRAQCYEFDPVFPFEYRPYEGWFVTTSWGIRWLFEWTESPDTPPSSPNGTDRDIARGGSVYGVAQLQGDPPAGQAEFLFEKGPCSPAAIDAEPPFDLCGCRGQGNLLGPLLQYRISGEVSF